MVLPTTRRAVGAATSRPSPEHGVIRRPTDRSYWAKAAAMITPRAMLRQALYGERRSKRGKQADGSSVPSNMPAGDDFGIWLSGCPDRPAFSKDRSLFAGGPGHADISDGSG